MLTLTKPRSKGRVHERFVDGFDCENTLEVWVNVRKKRHDCGPDQSTVIVLRGLYKRAQSQDKEKNA